MDSISADLLSRDRGLRRTRCRAHAASLRRIMNFHRGAFTDSSKNPSPRHFYVRPGRTNTLRTVVGRDIRQSISLVSRKYASRPVIRAFIFSIVSTSWKSKLISLRCLVKSYLFKHNYFQRDINKHERLKKIRRERAKARRINLTTARRNANRSNHSR